MRKKCAKVSSTVPRAVRETEYIVFPDTDRPRPANNLFNFFFGRNGVLVANLLLKSGL